jgi:inner membrane protein
MIAPSHVIFSQSFFYTACILWSHQPTFREALVAVLASFIPDFDTRSSLPGRILPWLSDSIFNHFGHRTVTHALLPQLLVGLALFDLKSVPFGIALAIISGWLSHSWADMLTKNGVCWFWPSRVRCVLPGNPSYRCNVMGNGELAWDVVMLIAIFPLFMAAQTGQGATGLIRRALGDIESAVRQYQTQKGENAWYLKITGRSNATLEIIDGRYRIIDAASDESFLVEDLQGHTISVSHSSSTDWYAQSAVLEKGEPEYTTTFHIQRRQVASNALLGALKSISNNSRTYLAGNLFYLYKSGEKEQKTLEYLPLSELEPNVWLVDVDLRVQIKHSPSTVIPPLTIRNEPIKSDSVMEKWLKEALD